MKSLKRPTLRVLLALGLILSLTWVTYAAVGGLIATVELPGNYCSVTGTFDGKYYITLEGSENGTGAACAGSKIQVFQPPSSGQGVAELASIKDIVFDNGKTVNVSALAWDPKRGKLWAASGYSHNGEKFVIDRAVWLIDIGNPTVSGEVLAVFQFAPGVEGDPHMDGLAYDAVDDTLYHSPDIDCHVYHFSPEGTLLNTITPVLPVKGCAISGVVVGSDNTLYIGLNGYALIARVDKATGEFISDFATTAGRVEDLACDPVTYAPIEAILAKDAFEGLYEAFEVEPGTCPLPLIDPGVAIDIRPQSCPNPLKINSKGMLPVAILGADDLDVGQIDPDSIQLEGVSPIRWAMEDRAAPYEPFTGKIDAKDCTEEGPDGYIDLTLKFDVEEVVGALGDVEDGDVLVLKLTGKYKNGNPIHGEDVVVILKKGKK